jgi:hypothetical protein
MRVVQIAGANSRPTPDWVTQQPRNPKDTAGQPRTSSAQLGERGFISDPLGLVASCYEELTGELGLTPKSLTKRPGLRTLQSQRCAHLRSTFSIASICP